MRDRKAGTRVAHPPHKYPSHLRYRVSWVEKSNGDTGSGPWTTKEVAHAACFFANKGQNRFLHWIEDRTRKKANEKRLREERERFKN